MRISTTKLNTDCICLGHLASNAQPLQENNSRSFQENSQSQRAYFCGHIIKPHHCEQYHTADQIWESWVTNVLKSSFFIGRLRPRKQSLNFPN